MGCSQSKITRRYSGPLADGIIVRKAERRMLVLKGNRALTAHDVDLGFAPTGHKVQQGDGRTPEGQYFIDRRNYNSSFFLSLGISYPNAADIARAKAAGVDPGSVDPATGIDAMDLYAAMARLDPDDRALLAMRYVAGFDSNELSKATGISPSGTRSRIERALKRLRKDLSDG